MIQGGVFKIKEGKLDVWRAWCKDVGDSLYSESFQSLQDEQVLQEAVFLFEIEGEHYVLGFSEGECLSADMSKEVNIRHKQIKQECLERVSKIETLYFLKQ